LPRRISDEYAALVRSRIGRTAFSYGWTAVASAEAIAAQMVRPSHETMVRHTRRWARVLISRWEIDLRTEGMERIPLDRVCVIVANHQSYLDVIALFASMPVTPVFLAKRELERAPLFGRAMKLGGHVFVDRGKHDRAMEAMERAAKELRVGLPLAVFPEGTRAREPIVRPFKKGAFHLAKSAGACIVPIGIHGSLEAWPRSAIVPEPGRVDLRVGAPIDADDVARLPLDALIERARTEVAALAGYPLA
jgi:1-acyl-sn-glycerol-3-phosphate acyltransferase